MQDAFLQQILGSPLGSFAFVLALLLGSVWLVHWVTIKIAHIQAKHDSFTTDVKDMKTDINEIRKDISFLKGSFEMFKSSSQQSPVQSHSPLSPNEIGEKIIEELDLTDIIARNSDKIMSYLNANIGSKNPYDIQQFCIETASVELDQLFSEADVNIVKKYAFNHGRVLFYYGSLIGVLIRDLYFQRNNIDLNEVDKCDPNK